MRRIIVAAIFQLAVMGNHAAAQWHVEPSNGKPVPEYNLSIRLMPDLHRLEASGTVALPAEPTPRTTVMFALRADMGTPRVEVLKPALCAGVAGLRAAGDDKELALTKQWEIKPKRPCPTGAPILLGVSYAGGSGAKGSGFFNLGPEGSFGNAGMSAWAPIFGYQRGTGSLRFTVPKGTVVIASGTLARRQDVGDSSIFEFKLDSPASLDFAAGAYTVVRRREGRIPVTLYLFREHPLVEEMLVGCSRAMEVLENEFGKYPFGEFAVVESPTEASQAAGFLGVAFQGFFLARSDYLERSSFDLAFFGHELSHEWFPYLVGRKGDTPASMLSEAMAHYGSLRTVEEIEGSAAAERHRRGDGNAFRLMAAGFDYALGALPSNPAAQSLSNTKGYVVYDMLSRTVGRDKFRAALRIVTRKYAFGAITWDEFLREIEHASGQDLSWFYEQWFTRPGSPTISLSWRQEGDSLKYTITQERPAYRLSLPVQIEFADGSAVMQEAQVQREKHDFVIPMPRRVHAVRLDPHFEVFHTTPEQKSEAEALRYFTRGRLEWDFNQTDEARKTFQEGLRHLPEVDAYGVAFLLHLYIGWIHQEANRLDEAKREYELALAQAIRPKDYLPRLYLNIAKIAAEQGDRPRVVWAAQNVLATERALGRETGRSRQARQLLE